MSSRALVFSTLCLCMPSCRVVAWGNTRRAQMRHQLHSHSSLSRASASTAGESSIDLTTLNSAQLHVVNMPLNLAVVCSAGPGSGKTRVLAFRMARLLTHHKVAPDSILAVTFTNRAANEMKHRLECILSPLELPAGIRMTTFHSFCCRVLRTIGGRTANPGKVGAVGHSYLQQITGSATLTSEFGIYDQSDCIKVLKGLVKELDTGAAHVDFKYGDLMTVMSKTREMLVMSGSSAAAEGVYDVPPSTNLGLCNLAAELLPLYTERMYSNNALDFDSLLLLVYQLLNIDSALHILQRKHRHILVDEYQDTNAPQYEIVKRLCPPELLSSTDVPRSLFIVGDANQAIYSWRGARSSNMRTFAADYSKNTAAHGLLDNYRSTVHIVEVANAVLGSVGTRAANPSEHDAPEVELIECSTDDKQAETVVSVVQVVQAFNGGSLAVMYRTNDQSRALEKALVRHGIRYTLVGRPKFYERHEVKDVCCFLRVLGNAYDSISLGRALDVHKNSVNANSDKKVRGPGPKTFDAFMDWVEAHHAKCQELGLVCPSYLSLLISLRDRPMSSGEKMTLTKPQIKSLQPFAEYMRSLRNSLHVTPLAQLACLIAEEMVNSKYLMWLSKDSADEAADRMGNVDEVLLAVSNFASDDLIGFLDEVALMSDTEGAEEPDATSAVHLMTIHASKGLEYDCVILTGAEDCTLPLAGSTPEEIEEEKRLAYVAVTRARLRLFVLHRSFIVGFRGVKKARLSRFFESLRGSRVVRATSKQKFSKF